MASRSDPLKNSSMKGMFLAEPKKGFEQIPRARLIDLKEENSEEIVSRYDQGIQSFPILLDPRGRCALIRAIFKPIGR